MDPACLYNMYRTKMKNLGDVFQLSQGSKTQTSGFALRLILCCQTVCRDAWTDNTVSGGPPRDMIF